MLTKVKKRELTKQGRPKEMILHCSNSATSSTPDSIPHTTDQRKLRLIYCIGEWSVFCSLVQMVKTLGYHCQPQSTSLSLNRRHRITNSTKMNKIKFRKLKMMCVLCKYSLTHCMESRSNLKNPRSSNHFALPPLAQGTRLIC